MSDLIDRQAAIDIAPKLIITLDGYEMHNQAVVNYCVEITQLPPAQLSTNMAEVGTDCISRQALLDKFEPWLKVKDYNDGELNMLKAVLYEIRFMRPAQPEPSQVAADIARIVENGQDMRVIEAAQPTPDQNGDLWITVPDIDKVTCIYVQESKSKFCRIYYEEQEQPEPFTSKWIPIGMADAVGGESAMWGDKIAYHVCEKCWKQALERDGEEVLSDFCPNCGAEMEVTT